MKEMGVPAIAGKGRRHPQSGGKGGRLYRFSTYLRKHWFLYLLMLPGFCFMAVFNYGPMYGILLAFKDYSPRLGVLGSPWAGFEHFQRMFADPNFIRAFKNTIIILTSNLGSQFLLDGINDKGEIEESARQQVMAALHQQFRPEFLNRLDEIICFKPLTKTELNGIIDILTAALRQRLEDKSLGLEITDAAKQLIIDRGFDPVFGARPLKRYLQSTVETLIARAILAGDMPAGHVIKVDVRDGELACE